MLPFIQSASLYVPIESQHIEGLRFFALAKDGVEAIEVPYQIDKGEASAVAFVFAVISILDFNAQTHNLLVSHSGCADFVQVQGLDRLRYDLSRIEEKGYLLKNVLGPMPQKAVRYDDSSPDNANSNLSSSDFMYAVYCLLDVADPSSAYYGGFITVVVFRIAEQLALRSVLVDRIISYYEAMERSRPSSGSFADSTRWRLSSAVNLAILLLYLEREEEACAIVERKISGDVYSPLPPLTYMNRATLLFLSSLVALAKGKRDIAWIRAGSCADFCCDATASLFSLRNPFFFDHQLDVSCLTKTGYESAALFSLLSGKHDVSGTKYASGKYGKKAPKASLASPFMRFKKIIGANPPFVDKMLRIIDDIRREVDANPLSTSHPF